MNVANAASPSARDRLVGERTALINQLRGILLERGIASRQRRRKLAHGLGHGFCAGVLGPQFLISSVKLERACHPKFTFPD